MEGKPVSGCNMVCSSPSPGDVKMDGGVNRKNACSATHKNINPTTAGADFSLKIDTTCFTANN